MEYDDCTSRAQVKELTCARHYISGASTESKNEVNTYASPNEALTLKS